MLFLRHPSETNQQGMLSIPDLLQNILIAVYVEPLHVEGRH